MCAGSDDSVSVLEDPYRFGPVLGELDVWLLSEGTHLRPFEVLGAQLCTHRRRVAGTRFAVWAPNASRVSVVGDFNLWGRPASSDAAAPGVRRLGDLPAGRGREGAHYKYELCDAQGAAAAAARRPLCAARRAAPGHPPVALLHCPLSCPPIRRAAPRTRWMRR
jgi:1,4-alpha-glucan branching enzyme